MADLGGGGGGLNQSMQYNYHFHRFHFILIHVFYFRHVSAQCPKFLSENCPKLGKKCPKIKRPKFFASNV